MLGRLLRTAVNEYLRRRSGGTGRGPRRTPQASAGGFRNEAVQSILRVVLERLTKRR